MKKLLCTLTVAANIAILAAGPAAAEEKKIVGPITKVQMDAPKAGNATLTVKDGKSGTEYKMVVSDTSTLEKIKAKKMDVDHEVRAKFDTGSGEVKSIKRTAGCD